MEINIERWVCDHCKKTEESDGTVYFGGSPDFVKWLTVTRFRKPEHSFSFEKERLHFCGATCLTEFFKEKS